MSRLFSGIAHLLAPLLVVALYPAVATAIETDDVRDTRSVVLGEAILADTYRQPFRAIALLELGEDQGRLGPDRRQALIYLARRYRELDMPERALELYRHIAGMRDDALAQQAYLELAKLAIALGRHEEAERVLPKLGTGLSNGERTERALVEALVHLYRRNEKAALEAIPKFKHETTWSLYQRYNIGATLLSHYRNRKGALILARLGKLDPEGDPERAALRDQANLALGYSLLQLGKPAQARKYLARINLDTPMAAQALLGMGWAHSAEGNHEKALVYWLELQKRRLPTSFFYESVLAVPYGYGKAGALGQAARAYEQAIGRFEADIEAMEAAIGQIERGALVEILSDGTHADEFDWVTRWRPDGVGVARFLPLLMESPPFQAELREYRTLLKLRARFLPASQRLVELGQHPQSAAIEAPLAQARARFDRIEAGFGEALDEVGGRIDRLAIDILRSHQAQLRDYARQARFGMAQAIERATFGEDGP